MSPRRNYPKGKRRDSDDDEERLPDPGLIVAAPHGWNARVMTKERATKAYRCPGCDHEIRPGVTHVVAWRSGDDEGRRHWHTGCWRTARV